MQNRAQFRRSAAHDMTTTALIELKPRLRAGLDAVLPEARIFVAKAGDATT